LIGYYNFPVLKNELYALMPQERDTQVQTFTAFVKEAEERGIREVNAQA